MSDIEEVKTIGEVERIVLASGMWQGTGPIEFSDDGHAWSETWQPSEEHSHPEFARVEVVRDGVRLPTRVTIRWDEQFPEASDEWAAKWRHSPMRHFGRTARMVAYRQAFRDLLGDIRIEDEQPIGAATGAKASAPAERDESPTDWAAEFAAAETLDALDVLVKAARKARIFKPNAEGTALDREWKARRRAILAAEIPPASAQAEPKAKPEQKPRESREWGEKPAAQSVTPSDIRAALEKAQTASFDGTHVARKPGGARGRGKRRG